MTGDARGILLVEDEAVIREAMAAYLNANDYLVTEAADGQEALAFFDHEKHALIILDLMLPKLSGEEVCRTIRRDSDVPIIMLTAKGEIADRIAGLELGADDYLVKPFSPRELVARVRALLRRVQLSDDSPGETLVFGELAIDLAGHCVTLNGEEVVLTASEFKLLVTLARHPGRVYSRMELIEKVLGYDFEGYERTIDSHIKNLRSKLTDDPRKPHWLFTSHGAGYRFENPYA
ncbi:MAG: response regulator transcription factor [Coriobacteriales bacterium]|nr:response regulator transcription factor [Coriobacteriales bacterium]